MKMLKIANRPLEYIVWFVVLSVLAFSIYNDGGINILSHLLLSASLFALGLIILLRNPKIKVGLEVAFLMLFLVFFLFSYLFSQTKNVGLFELILFVSGVYLYIFISLQKWELYIFDKFLLGVLLLGFIAALYGYYCYIFEPFNRFASTFGIGIYKFVSYPNAFANFMIAIIPISFYFLQSKNTTKSKIFYYVTTIICLTALFLTYSRGAYITLLVVSILYLLFYALNMANIKLLFKKIVLILLLVFISGIFMFSVNQVRKIYHPQVISFTEKVYFESDEKNVSATSRLDFWKGSLEIFADNTYFGAGPGSFEYVFPTYQKSLLGNSNSPHNLFLKLLSENGLFVALSFFIFLLILFLQTIKIYKHIAKSEKILLYLLFAGSSAILLHNMIDYNLNFVSNILLLFIFLGMIGFIKNQYLYKKHKFVENSLFKYSLLVIGLAMLILSFHEAYYSYIFKQARSYHKNAEYEIALTKYEKSKNIIIKRGYYIVYAQLYFKIYEDTADVEYLNKAENLLLSGFELNKKDAFLVNYLGDVYYEMNKYEKANFFYSKALKLDPKNNLDYYYDVLRTENNLDDFKVDSILDLLEEYKIKLSQNAHLTVLTGNFYSAMDIYDFLFEQVETGTIDDEYKDVIIKSKNEMEAIYLNEKEKFERYYDLELKKEELN